MTLDGKMRNQVSPPLSLPCGGLVCELHAIGMFYVLGLMLPSQRHEPRRRHLHVIRQLHRILQCDIWHLASATF
jgi:hypothetical protein